MRIQFSETELALMRRLKAAFDPKGLLNPGKIFPE
jgi:FAD/FMN-containing dehydrogenase